MAKFLRIFTISGLFLIPLIPVIVAGGESFTAFFFPDLLFPFITGKNFAFRIIIEIIFASWILLALLEPKYRPKKTLILWSLAAFLAIIAVADVFSVNAYKSIWSNYERMEGLILHVHLFMYFLVAAAILSTEKLWNRFLHANIAVGIFVMLFSFLQLGGELAINQGGVRVDATLGNATYLAVYTLFNIFIILYFLYSNRGKLKDILWALVLGCVGFLIYYVDYASALEVSAGVRGITLSIIAAGATFVCLYLIFKKAAQGYIRIAIYFLLLGGEIYILMSTATRGAMIGLVCGLVFVFAAVAIVEKKDLFMRRLNIGLLVGLVALAAMFVVFKDENFIRKNPSLSRFGSLLDSDLNKFFLEGEGKSRYYNGIAALRAFKDRPVFGWGQESFNYVYYKYYNPKMYNQEPWFDRAHNVIFDWLVAGGILGLLAYLAIFFFVAHALWKGERGNISPEENDKLGRIVLTGLIGAYFIQNLTVFDNITSYIMFFAILALINTHYGKGEVIAPHKRLAAGSSAFYSITVAVSLLLIVGIYTINIKSILASNQLISALSANNPESSLQYFKSSLALNTPGKGETRQFLGQIAERVVSSPADDETKIRFVTFVEQEFRKQLKETPEDVRMHFIAGNFFMRIGKRAEAIQILERAAALSPNKQNVLIALAFAHLNSGEFMEGHELVKRAYDQSPEFEDIKMLYALTAIYAKKIDLAKEILGDKYEETITEDIGFSNALKLVN
ncbi:MAG: hypothetical protein A3G52_01640 [Candidatus Taylorbacteria bacterium RIFCSPLOWO2_12_FULL_43_20]|uniref:O-antigen ligase-related domain-containing protein n=1 Tax=Candidatus Taylorbacteria bacterium RIFCSPLOWO2_12_FULL_43_20 TaxID=1802332 RepID=A0A1G2NZV8_9BACT|nr:MAG: hypothetical protein A2825_00150 [Candidatus Taylorbacteria bacterium RIFCSPHIGHO2_01_FULL_43_120]OHA22134.1 MAG: hypothetical protein A3B98_03800 [Candidatus Taylorbacteria bacterium RIFCSPHIGHO2_02_FULL_43_55]OHA30428.1 MAG: hypothetical protein A3E92_04250 [Candidatus Taylorbacteria bacterium RIFCSPHIGHO2_12_FULL_42_34]OHA32385.1 MAG: hypothetical protein A3B09_03800 [Candidatus Taylorbacteria bacterium RIFCSPLOWO2_01_FULL_43_83]OHA37820.1 MAG: hypothetical protein A3H58_02870 [Candi